MRRLALVLAVNVLTGCGDNPTAPTSRIPEVAGTYTGPLTIQATANYSVQGSARFDVAQAGAQLTITGSFTLRGATAQLAAITGTIDEMGFFIPAAGGVAGVVKSCGRVNMTSTNITFSWRTVRWEEAASTEYCDDVELSGTLSR